MDKTRRLNGGEALGAIGPRRAASSLHAPRGGEPLHPKGRTAIRRGRAGIQIRAYVSDAVDSPAVAWEDDFDERYVAGRLLGKGSFGEVFLATDRHTGQEVAVKDMRAKRGRLTTERTLQKITNEVVVMRAVQAAHAMVRLLGTFKQGDRYRIVMEHCGGGDLKYHLKAGGPFSELQAALVAYEILEVIRACHDRNIVHGDVKTANFVLKSSRINPFGRGKGPRVLENGWMKAIDFGCSQFVDDSTRMRSRVGTPVFMSPEVFERNYSFESDLWSLGVLLYQLLSNRFPFWSPAEAGSVSTVHDVIEAVNSREPDFGYGPWQHISTDALDFLTGLLDKNYRTRMSAEDALGHQWIARHIRRDSQGALMLSNIVPLGTVGAESTAKTATTAAPDLLVPTGAVIVPA
ncbi:unnamed protein product [Ostreobium quekettii]|uniref:Protein kinase domain-containing protein n=1 Tax=Ostreobium quekettii TaxID=121088 RepID=A0A8S1J0X6_9CHLO|nr:unnamed protein product [Ostreobium quekettii]|eukprot:evm.model.scf_305.10 EVM.evm.TU.scf_305.10   scf_305:70584-73101(-)